MPLPVLLVMTRTRSLPFLPVLFQVIYLPVISTRKLPGRLGILTVRRIYPLVLH